MRYEGSISMAGAAGMGAQGQSFGPGPSGGGPIQQAAAQQAGLGLPMGIAALGPLVALVGKAIKDRGGNN